MEPHQLAMNKAKIQLMSRPDSVFFTTVCFSLKQVWNDTIPTADVDGVTMRVNPKFFMDLDPEERVFLLLHEAMHVAYLHMERLASRVHTKWNIAADHVINLMLIKRGFKMPQDGLADPQYEGMSTEQVYKVLPDTPPPKNMMLDLQQPPSDIEDIGQHVQDILVRASVQSEMSGDAPGTIPGDLQIYLDGLLDPKLPWHRILQKYLFSLAKDNYTFKKPNRRFFPQHILPSLYSEKIVDLAIAVDTSGSVSQDEFTAFVTEVASIFKMMKPETITLVQFDTSVKSVTKLKGMRGLMDCKFKGRGGTQIAPVMKWAKENNPKVMLIFSDGHFSFSTDKAPSANPFIWVIHNNKGFNAPFGRTIHYSL